MSKLLTNYKAWKESIGDTLIALVINYPANIILLTVAFELELTPFETATAISIIFTIIAIVRKYFVRVYFSKKNQKR